ncbi:MAG TPA: tetratricopeptide repeat protein, partial [Planctomycetaceae bacterium]
PHTSQTDHRIIRRPTSEKPVPAPPAMTVFDGAADRLPRIEVERGLGLVMAPLASSRNDPFLARRADAYLETARAAAPDDVEVLESLATVRALQGRTGEAIDLLREALKLDPDRESALVALAAACSEAGRNEEGVEALGRLFEVNPWHAEFHELHATMLARLGRTNEAIRAAERALELDPSLRDVCLLLADLHRQRGDAERGESYRQRAAKLPVLPRYSVRGLR